MPSEEWKLRTFKQKWYAGETISVGIGQGAVAVTPIQLARAIAGITSGGIMHRPHVAFPQQLPPNFIPAAASGWTMSVCPLIPKIGRSSLTPWPT